MAELQLIKGGQYDSIQDMGRSGFAHWGIPTGGAMDQIAMLSANTILENPENAAVLESSIRGGIYTFSASTLVVLSGIKSQAKLNKKVVPQLEVISVKSGDTLDLGQSIQQGFTYLAIKGGFQAEHILGSKSMYSSVTPFQNLQSKRSVKYPALKAATSFHKTNLSSVANHQSTSTIHVFPGPEFELLDGKLKTALRHGAFKIVRGDRMGYVLSPRLNHNLSGIQSAPVMPGTVQLTPAGNLIVLMRDAQTTGGYPRVLQLSEMAISQLSQLKGKVFGFELFRE